MIDIRSDGFSKPGRSGQNEDAVLRDVSHAGRKIFAVADGMGGAPGGGVASSLAVSSLESAFLHDQMERFDAHRLIASVQDALDQAASRDTMLREMGTTLSFCIIGEDGLFWTHVGDCRIYLIRDGTVRQLTKDQTVVQDMVDRGEISTDDARSHPRRNLLTSVLCPNRSHKCLSGHENLQVEDRILILSDGAYDQLSPDDLQSIADAKIGAAESCRRVLSLAESVGPQDDYSLIALRIA